MKDFDLLVIGAGPVGCVLANLAANQLNWKVLLLDKRQHIAGNCYDCYHNSGVMIHKYGPHYFRTNSKQLIDYLTQFTTWIPGNYYVKSYSRDEYFPFPINILTLEQFYNTKLTPQQAKDLLEKVREKIENPANSEEFVLSKVGRELYEAFYLGYTLKQWDIHPQKLDASVAGRIPIRFNKDQRYVDHKYQLTPEFGFTRMFQNMIDHKNIHLLLNTDYKDIKNDIIPKKAVLYTGPVDEYFDYSFGKLPWRSLSFEFKLFQQEYVQPVVQINYPNDFDYTRSVEIKHVTRQRHHQTIISYEYPNSEGEPFYPVPNSENQKLFEKYREAAKKETEEKNVFFAGRLANYTYLNTDQAIESAFEIFNRIKAI